MQGYHFQKSLPYLLPSGTGTTLFYTAPFLVMLLYAFSAARRFFSRVCTASHRRNAARSPASSVR